MTTLLVGHRGVGKSRFLKQCKLYRPELNIFDLDEMLGANLDQLFSQGEAFFREQERQSLARVLGQRPDLVAVGAGFEGPIPDKVRVVHLKRLSDEWGRCFTDRPRLNSGLSPLDEYRERYPVRERRYQDWADEELLVPEGYESGLEGYFLDNLWHVPYVMTLLPENFRDLEDFLRKRQTWGVHFWELRNDWLNQEQIQLALKLIPTQQILYALRKDREVPARCRTDWALELGEPPDAVEILSLHERQASFAETLEKLKGPSPFLKLAIEVKDFTELEQGHRWCAQDPLRRSFLPRSRSGRWRWYRSLFGPRMPLHFVREGRGSCLDQPPLWQCALQPPMQTAFAAVLGQPVDHSYSPMMHRDSSLPFVSIEIGPEEFSFALKFLSELGLKCAAVTAPLKKMAWAHAHELTPEARATQAANTLLIKSGQIFAHNTDVGALSTIRANLPTFNNVWLWGGGGIKSSVRAVWPDLREIGARQGVAGINIQTQPDLLIWAAGQSVEVKFPPPEVTPSLVYDLNYSDASSGKEWAVGRHLPYASGFAMFRLQAQAQREFWRAKDT